MTYSYHIQSVKCNTLLMMTMMVNRDYYKTFFKSYPISPQDTNVCPRPEGSGADMIDIL